MHVVAVDSGDVLLSNTTTTVANTSYDQDSLVFQVLDLFEWTMTLHNHGFCDLNA